MAGLPPLDAFVLNKLRCPICRSELHATEDAFKCRNHSCPGRFPIINDIPVFLNETTSLFSAQNIDPALKTDDALRLRIRGWLDKALPDIDINLGTKSNFDELSRLLVNYNPNPYVLIVGGRVMGSGMQQFLSNPSIGFVETDIAPGPRTQLICDAQDIPFEKETFDAVIIQAVLEHVTDPYRSVEEIYRVLNESGFVYAETPFMQPVHMGRYDFTRFSHLGHRRLFRKFKEIKTGAVGGPGQALALSAKYFLWSLVTSKAGRFGVHVLSNLTLFWLKYFDYLLIGKPGTFDAAAGYYFLGRKSAHVLSDKALIEQYRGSFR